MNKETFPSQAPPVIPVTTIPQIERLCGEDKDLSLDLLNLDIEESIHAVCLITSIRKHLESGYRLVLHHPPQILAHNLYRMGFLNHPFLRLDSIRMEESSAS